MVHRLRSRLFVRSLEDRIAPATFTVMNLNDSGADSLRACIINANAAVGADTINFKAGLAGFITLISGELVVTSNSALTIQGPGASQLWIFGNNSGRIFNISNPAAGTAINISGLTLREGKSTGDGGAIFGDNQKLTLTGCDFQSNKSSQDGGAVAITGGGTLQATDCTFTGNTAAIRGGALYFIGDKTSATLLRCTLSSNQAASDGGAAYVDGSLLLDSCTLSGNIAGDDGGGLLLDNFYDPSADFTVRNSTISGNKADDDGGGIYLHYLCSSSINVQNSTISGNTAADDGGGIFLFFGIESLKVQNSTVTGNTANDDGGGINNAFYFAVGPADGTISLESSIVSGNTAKSAPDIYSIDDVPMSFSAVGSNSGFFMTDKGGNLPFQPHANLKLGPLTNNGGPTLTHAPASTSPLLNVGNNSSGLTNDQRGAGFPRVFGTAGDIGAVEVRAFVVTNTNDNGMGSLRQAVLDSNALSGADTIEFASGLSGNITLTSGEIGIGDALTINGPGSSVIMVSGNNASRILDISSAPSGSSINISGLTFTNGFGSGFSSSGGAIRGTNQSLQVTACVFSANKSAGTFNGIGGAIVLTAGTLTATNSIFTGNTAATRGGALAIQSTGCKLTLNGCAVSGNSSADGGGVYVNDNLTILNSTISGNSAIGSSLGAGRGGGILALGNFAAGITIRNSTLSGNFASFSGGGIALSGEIGNLTVQNSTFTGNSATGSGSYGGGGGIARLNGTPSITLESTIVSGNTNAIRPDIYSKGIVNVKTSAVGSGLGFTKTDLGGNLPFQPHDNLKLAPLANNGGTMLTHGLLAGSPAINAGSNPGGLLLDQRGTGFARSFGQTDIGAFEVQSSLPPTKVTNVQINDGSAQRSRVTSLQVTFNNPPALPTNPANGFQLKSLSDDAVVTLSANASGNTVTLTFTSGPLDFGSLADGLYALTVFAIQIPNLDSDGSGIAGDDFQLIGTPANGLFRLFGDADGNGTVNSGDFATFRTFFGIGPSFLDFNNDGQTNSDDFAEFRKRFGITLGP